MHTNLSQLYVPGFQREKSLACVPTGSHAADGATLPSSTQIDSHPSPNTNYDFQEKDGAC